MSDTVICVFERDLENYDKGELIQIFETPKDAFDYIQNAENNDLFYEQWQITKTTKGVESKA